ncbi:MAG: tRNA uracil 4-sulfurtransferase ThiI [Thermoplasmata archaeon]
MKVIIRYDEIGLKGKNRPYFENMLIDNIRRQLNKSGFKVEIERVHNRIIVDSNAHVETYSKIFGIRSYSPAFVSSLDLNEIYSVIREIIKDRNFNTFKISAKRLWKEFYLTSMQINEKIGEMVQRNFSKKVDLENPDIDIGIEILRDRAFIFTERYPGPGGLPYGVEGKILMLISGGIDSPVASYMLMKRGGDLTFIHFKTTDEILKKVRKHIEILNTYSPKDMELIVEDHREMIKNVIINLSEINKLSWTCVFCRYSMLRRASEIAEEIKAHAIGTGDSLGQVASQTLKNIMVENLATNFPVLRPLIGFDKIEIENYAKKIGTFDVSVSVRGCGCPFLPQKPITNASLDDFLSIKNLVLKPAEKEYLPETYERNTC